MIGSHVLLAGSLLFGTVINHQPANPGTSRALIVIGLPGDAAHEKLFLDLGTQYRDWLKRLGFDLANVRMLVGRKSEDDKDGLRATKANIEKVAAELKSQSRPEDRLWVFFIGHGSWDGEHASFHLPGPDLRDDQLAQAFRGVPCREQVFWLTGSASGWFLKPLSAKGRIVITATEPDNEFNETEFPEALATVIQRPPEQLDSDQDGQLSVLELYRHIQKEVTARFAKDTRAPTEHARLDDDGDGSGTEEIVLAGNQDGKKATSDGALAGKTFVRFASKR